MYDEKISEIKEKIELANKTKDLVKIKKDINEGMQLLSINNDELKKKYLNKIDEDYAEYVYVMKIGFSIRSGLLGNSTIRSLINYDEQITQDVRMLQLISSEKLYEEIKKVIIGEKNKFEGGILDEQEF